MNRFEQLIDEMRERARQQGVADEVLNGNEDASGKWDAEPAHLKLPYSSDPEPIGEVWK